MARRKQPEPEKANPEAAALKALAQAHAPAALAELTRLASGAESESVRLAAVKEILDRAYGRVAATVTDKDGTLRSYVLVDDGY